MDESTQSPREVLGPGKSRSKCTLCRCFKWNWDGDEQGEKRCNTRFAGVAGGQICGHREYEHEFDIL